MVGRGKGKPSMVHQCNPGTRVNKMSMAVVGGRGRWWDLESVVGGQHFFSSAVGLQGFCGVDILRQLRLASHHGPLFLLFMLQLLMWGKKGGLISSKIRIVFRTTFSPFGFLT